MLNTAYQHLAVCYDTLMNVDYKSWSNYLIDLIKYKPHGLKLLDVGCGTGTMSKLMSEAGFKVTGVDSSTAMLNMAWKHVKSNLQFVNQSVVDLNLAQQYPVILSTCDVFNYITTEQEIEKALNNVFDHLSDDGMFLFDISSYNKLKHFLGNNSFSDITNDIAYIWDNFYDDEEDILNMQITFFMPYEETGLYYRCDEEHFQKAWHLQEIVTYLRRAGFKSIRAYEAFTFDPPNDESDRIQFVAYKEEQSDVKYISADNQKKTDISLIKSLPKCASVEELIDELKKITQA